MRNQPDEVLQDKFRERFDRGIDIALEELKKDQYYIDRLTCIKESVSSNDMEKLLDNQMTVHNMELKAVYRAGHRDCICFLKEIGKLT